MKGEEGFFIRVQNRPEYETQSHDYDGFKIDGAVCAIQIENPDLSLEECIHEFEEIGLENYPKENKYMVLFEGIKFEEIEDGCIAKMDAIRKIWDLRENKMEFDFSKNGGNYL